MLKSDFKKLKFEFGMEFLSYRKWQKLISVDFELMEFINEFGAVFCISEVEMIKNREGEVIYPAKKG